MPEITLPEVKLPEIKLPDGFREMTKDDIVQAAKDVRLPKRSSSRKSTSRRSSCPSRSPTECRAGGGRTRSIPLLALTVVGLAVVAAWWLFTSATTGPRVRRAVDDLRSRMNSEPSDLIRYDNETHLDSLVEPGRIGSRHGRATRTGWARWAASIGRPASPSARARPPTRRPEPRSRKDSQAWARHAAAPLRVGRRPGGSARRATGPSRRRSAVRRRCLAARSACSTLARACSVTSLGRPTASMARGRAHPVTTGAGVLRGGDRGDAAERGQADRSADHDGGDDRAVRDALCRTRAGQAHRPAVQPLQRRVDGRHTGDRDVAERSPRSR